ncbi:MAG: NAD(P)/FAD-dependent oxidoreductase [Bacteroidetes bacterium]|nr:NAD(P)/FAD-dependent oxidoreductase [Bacteroidota bacterium]
MTNSSDLDAIIVGSGPNGLAAAITMAMQDLNVAIYEAHDTIGGGMRTKELTLPGFLHDVCSSIHPTGVGSPFMKSIPLGKYGLEWVYPEASLAHPLDDGPPALLVNSIEETAGSLRQDIHRYIKLIKPLVDDWNELAPHLLGPLSLNVNLIKMGRFGIQALQPASIFARNSFKGEMGRGFFAGLAAHSILPLDKISTAAIGIVLNILGHDPGWPMPKGGAQEIANAMGKLFESLGGKIYTSSIVKHLDELPKAKTYLLDVTPKQLIEMAGNRLPWIYINRLKGYRYGSGVFKMDWALSEPIPFKEKDCHKAGTVHLGGTLEEIIDSEKKIGRGEHPDKPFVLLAQNSLFDPSRAPNNKHTAWGYCHVPNGSTVDMINNIESQIERFAPGFKDTILARHSMNTMDFQEYNANYIGGDINGGVQDIGQMFTRPVMALSPYKTPAKGLYICSSSTPPGGGVHGMCGFHAAKQALKDIFNIRIDIGNLNQSHA